MFWRREVKERSPAAHLTSETITSLVNHVKSKFSEVKYPNDSEFYIPYDDKIDQTLSSVLSGPIESGQINQLLEDVVNGVFKPNCWQTILLINLFLDEQSIYKTNQDLESIQYELLNPFDRKSAYGRLLGLSEHKATTLEKYKWYEEHSFGSTIFIFGTAHVVMYTQTNQTLSHWTGSEKVDGFKEIPLETLVDHIFSDPNLLVSAIDNYLSEADLLGLNDEERQIAGEILDELYDFIDENETYTESDKERFKNQCAQISFIHMTPPIIKISNTLEKTSLRPILKEESTSGAENTHFLERKSALSKDLKKYSHKFFKYHGARAKSLLTSLEDTSSNKDLHQLLEVQKALFFTKTNEDSNSNHSDYKHEENLKNTKQGDYYNIIAKHLSNFSA